MIRSALRPAIRAAVRPVLNQHLRGGDPIAALFADGQKGDVWLPTPDNLFVDTAETTPVASDGDLIGRSVGAYNGVNADQSTTAKKPAYKTDGTLEWFLSDGADDSLIVPKTAWSADSSVFVFGELELLNAGQFPYLVGADSADSGGLELLFYGGTTVPRVALVGTPNVAFNSANPVGLNTKITYSGYWDRAAGTSTLNINGTTETKIGTAGNSAVQPDNSFVLFDGNLTNGTNLGAKVYAVGWAYGDYTQAQRNAVHAALAAKSGR